MRYNVTELDKMLLQHQNEINYKYRLYVLDREHRIVDELMGVSSIGSYNIDADSNIRRTTSFVLELDNTYSSTHIEEKIETWIGYDFSMQIGIYYLRENEYIWYDCGSYTITSTNTSYDAATNTLSTELSDWFSKLDGTRNGQIGGAPTILIPNLDDEGNKITIRSATVGVLKDNQVEKYIVQDIGEFYGMDMYNQDYMEYREGNPNWNQLPYDLEYNVGCHVADILIDIRDLYPNCEMYYDIYNNFCFNMIPSCDNEEIVCSNEFLQSILVAESSESVTYDISSIKNITEVFGKTYDVDSFCEECTYSSNVYTLTLDKYEKYENNQIISFTAPANNLASAKFRINSLSSIPIYNEGTTEYIAAGTMQADTIYAVKLGYKDDAYVAYFLGSFQPHAICVLTADANDSVYTKEYFEEKYNCKNVTFRVEENNPFTIQRIGEVLDVKTGDEFDNIISDSVAIQNALYYNKKSSTSNDIVTLTTKMIPWLDVNIKVSYKKQQESEEHEYIVKSIANDLSSMTSNITLYRFYPLYFD